ncbi:hypothetical protein LCGC14_0427550 [marine sediment metagenome]|uniref:Uncharacterized protein n=1 Tax=marine sediment metagenome TaxID=412755 RepID=A0A0F9SP29_9ZZZZ
MVFEPNAEWIERNKELDKRPIYYIKIDGLTDRIFSTAPLETVWRPRTNFGLDPDTPEVAGHRLDGGAAVSSVKGYGWINPMGDSGARYRTPGGFPGDFTDVERSFVFTDGGNTIIRKWIMTGIPNDDYEVSAMCGDVGFLQGPHLVVVNGVIIINRESTAIEEFIIRKKTVTVTNNQLEVNIGGHDSGGVTTLNEILITRNFPEARPLLTRPASTLQRVDRLQGRTTVGAIRFALLDRDDEITRLISIEKTSNPELTSLVNRKVSLFQGFDRMDPKKFAEIYRGRISGVSMTPGNASYQFELSDLKRKFGDLIMKNAETDALSVLEGNLVNIFYAVLTSDFTSMDFPLDEASGSPTGLGLDSSLLNLSDLIEVRDLWISTLNLRFEFGKPEAARTFVEQELMRLIGYAVVLHDGRISVRASNPPLIVSPNPTQLTADQITGPPAWRKRMDLHFNRFVIRGDHNNFEFERALDGTAAAGQKIVPLAFTNGYRVDHVYLLQRKDGLKDEAIEVASINEGASVVTKENLVNAFTAGDFLKALPFRNLVIVEDSANQNETDELVEFVIQSRGLRKHLNGRDLATFIATRLKRRYSTPPVEIKVNAQMREQFIEIGDVLLLSHPQIPDLLTGTRGVVDQPFEVIRAEIDFKAGGVKLVLLDTVPQSRFGVIAENNVPDYPTATARQRAEAAFMADQFTNLMVNGDPPYLTV